MSTLFCSVKSLSLQPDQHYDAMSVKSFFHTDTTFEGSCIQLYITILTNLLYIPSVQCLLSYKSIPVNICWEKNRRFAHQSTATNTRR